ncbi:hypothetical protein H4219_004684, partial [Mycoemilia scoparia]
MDITTPVAISKGFIACQIFFNQFQDFIQLLLDKTSINEQGIAEEELSSMKSILHQLLGSALNDLSSTYDRFIENNLPVAYLRITFLDFHNGVLLPLLAMYYGTDTVT